MNQLHSVSQGSHYKIQLDTQSDSGKGPKRAMKAWVAVTEFSMHRSRCRFVDLVRVFDESATVLLLAIVNDHRSAFLAEP